MSCPVCVRIVAGRYARAIGLAAPAHQFLLTQVGDDWATIRERVKRFRRIIRRTVDRWEDVVHVEKNPAGTGHHIHGWHWGDEPPVGALIEAAVGAGMGPFADLEPRVLEVGRPLAYGLKTVLEGSPLGTSPPPATRAYLEVNGGRLAHATPGFWRAPDGTPLNNLREAVRYTAGDGEWVGTVDPALLAP